MQDVEQFMRDHDLPMEVQEKLEVIICDAKEKVLKLLAERGVLNVK